MGEKEGFGGRNPPKKERMNEGEKMEINITNGEVHASANTGNRQWVAIIVGLSEKWRYDRKFVANQPSMTCRRYDGYAKIEAGQYIESVRFSHSGKGRNTIYYLFDGEKMQEISEDDMRQKLHERETQKIGVMN